MWRWRTFKEYIRVWRHYWFSVGIENLHLDKKRSCEGILVLRGEMHHKNDWWVVGEHLLCYMKNTIWVTVIYTAKESKWIVLKLEVRKRHRPELCMLSSIAHLSLIQSHSFGCSCFYLLPSPERWAHRNVQRLGWPNVPWWLLGILKRRQAVISSAEQLYYWVLVSQWWSHVFIGVHLYFSDFSIQISLIWHLLTDHRVCSSQGALWRFIQYIFLKMYYLMSE